MSRLLDQAETVLRVHGDPRTGLFPTHFRPGFAQSYETHTDPAKLGRYSAICLLGLRDAALTRRFLADPPSATDPGLMMMLDPGHRFGPHRLTAWLAGGPDLQEVSWMISGLIKAERTTEAQQVFHFARRRYVDPDSLFPRHLPSGPRRHLVSFGALAYWLTALFQLADDPIACLYAETLTAEIIRSQRKDGGWPWLYHVGSGGVREDFPVYTVHQDAMAPMFLLPAHQAGVPDALRAVRSGLSWCRRQDALPVDPFHPLRALARPGDHRWKRGIRAALPGRGRDPAQTVPVDHWRSYHLGWLLYVWHDRPQATARLLEPLAVSGGDGASSSPRQETPPCPRV